MARPTSRRRSPVSKALIELRRRLGETQQSMSQLLGCALQSIARWETITEPQSITLVRLTSLARKHHHDDLAEVFAAAFKKFQQSNRREAENILLDTKRWDEILERLAELHEVGFELVKEKHPAGTRVSEIAARLNVLTDAAREWAWRNR